MDFDFSRWWPLLLAGCGAFLLGWLARARAAASGFIRRWLTTTLTLRSEQHCSFGIRDFLDWLEEEDPRLRRARTRAAPVVLVDTCDSFREVPSSRLDNGIYWVRIFGVRCLVTVFGERAPAATHDASYSLHQSWSESVVVRAFTRRPDFVNAITVAVCARMARLRERTVRVTPVVGNNRMPSAQWPRRPAESVITDSDAVGRMVRHIRAFHERQARDIACGIPRRTGILLCGEAGGGKTSAIHAAASELRMSVYLICLSESVSAADFLQAWGGLGVGAERCMIVIEDVDTVQDIVGDREVQDHRGPRGKGINLGTILNVLDGFGSNQDQVVVLTTNYPDRIDPALLRPGRVDLRIDVGLPSWDAARRLWIRFAGGDESGWPAMRRRLESDRAAAQAGPGRPMAALQHLFLGAMAEPPLSLADEPEAA